MRHLSTPLAALVAEGSRFAASQAQAQTGGYVGVSAGYGWTNARASTSTVFSATGYFATTSVPAIAAAGIQTVKPAGVDAGLDAGYDWHSGSLMFGVAGDVSVLDGSKSATTTMIYPCCSPTALTITQSVKTSWMTTARARVGFDMSGASIYVTGGYAGLKARYSALFTDTFATAHEAGSKSEYRSGWVVGGGADIRVSRNWSLQPEYLHAEFGHINAPGGVITAFTPAISFPTNTFTHSARLTTNVVRVGIHYHFGAAEAPPPPLPPPPPPPPPAPAMQTCPDGSV